MLDHGRFTPTLGIFLIVSVLLGCTGSRESQDEREGIGRSDRRTYETRSGSDEPKLSGKNDTLTFPIQNERPPEYESRTVPPPPSGSLGPFVVQVGAYKMAENAERIASLTRERYARDVRTVYDRSSDLYKVMVGSFLTKDDARRFRDEMAQRYPSEYKDAWVSEYSEK